LHCFYPEQIFLSYVLPTRNKREFREFKEHCKDLWQTRRYAFLIVPHPIQEIDEFSSGPLNFIGFLWKTRVVLAANGITEEYSLIQRSASRRGADRPALVPRYVIHYPWTGDLWTTTVL
jgi:hypothetical protein